MPDDHEAKAVLPLRQFTFFHRNMLISTDTQLSVHTDVKMEGDTLAGYMHTTVRIMHQHFPDNVIEESFVWDITRENRAAWAIPPAKLEKLHGEAYDARIRRQKTTVQNWYMARVEKIEPLLHTLVMQMFIDGYITVDKMEMLVQEKYRPQGDAEMIPRLPWDESGVYET